MITKFVFQPKICNQSLRSGDKIQNSILGQKSQITIFSIFISILNWKSEGTFHTRIKNEQKFIFLYFYWKSRLWFEIRFSIWLWKRKTNKTKKWKFSFILKRKLNVTFKSNPAGGSKGTFDFCFKMKQVFSFFVLFCFIVVLIKSKN